MPDDRKARMAVKDLALETGNHVVQFYEHESELAQTAGRYLSDAAQAGAVAIGIATEAHRHAFVAEFEAAGVDSAKARRDGRLILLDAATTLASFMPEGRIDREQFRQVVGSVIRQAGETGRPVRAYGEMVALLWDAGDVLATIELEKLWNELGRELEFSLLCGYHSQSVQEDEHAEALRQVCHLHSAVLPTPAHDDSDAWRSAGTEVSAQFPAERDAPRSARHFVADALGRWGYADGLVDDAKLLVTELATNAVVHARSTFSVVARTGGPGVRVSVHDASPVEPTLRDGDPTAQSGRGLQLVAALSASWGVDVTAEGKTVWAELHP
ncbi:MAG: MEDS domain-containing protein [Solirubrobacteraceae bacterium]